MARALLGATTAVLITLFFAGTFAPLPVAAQPELALTARNAILVDADSGQILYASESDARVAPASLTKLFTAFSAIESTPLHRSMTIAESDLVGESSAGLWTGATMSFEALLHGMLLPSGNDAATAIARNLGAADGAEGQQAVEHFIADLNARLAELGLANTRLVNPHGLDEPGHYSSARDIAALTLYALRNEPTFATVIGTSSYQQDDIVWHNSNRLLDNYDGILGGKTGMTDNAGNCLVEVAQRDGRTLISVIMGSTADDWYYDAATLLDYGFAGVAGSGANLGRIVFPQEQPSAAGASGAAFELANLSDGRQVVSSTAPSEQPLWRALKWPLIALLACLMVSVCCAQYQAWQRLKTRRRRPAPVFVARGTERFDVAGPIPPRPWKAPMRAPFGASAGD